MPARRAVSAALREQQVGGSGLILAQGLLGPLVLGLEPGADRDARREPERRDALAAASRRRSPREPAPRG